MLDGFLKDIVCPEENEILDKTPKTFTIEEIGLILTESLLPWSAGNEAYDYIQFIVFNKDGTGKMVWGGGQQIYTELEFHYTFDHRKIKFNFYREQRYTKILFSRKTKLVEYELTEGPFEVSYQKRGVNRYFPTDEADEIHGPFLFTPDFW